MSENTPTHFVKCRMVGKKAFSFLTSKGGTNRLRIHAAQFTQENAYKLVADNAADNPEWEFIVVRIDGKAEKAATMPEPAPIAPNAGECEPHPLASRLFVAGANATARAGETCKWGVKVQYATRSESRPYANGYNRTITVEAGDKTAAHALADKTFHQQHGNSDENIIGYRIDSADIRPARNAGECEPQAATAVSHKSPQATALKFVRGINSPESVYPFEPVFAEPCKADDYGAWRNLGGYWVRERGDNRHNDPATKHAAQAARLDALTAPDAVAARWAEKPAVSPSDDINAPNGHCDTCGAPCDKYGCQADRSHAYAIDGSEKRWSIDPEQLREFVAAYIDCALWSSAADTSGNDDTSFQSAGYNADDIATDTRKAIEDECADFMQMAGGALAEAYAIDGSGMTTPSDAGHDFWLTRNGHGAGFWDRGLGAIGDKLTEYAKTYDSSDLYLGDDDLIHIA